MTRDHQLNRRCSKTCMGRDKVLRHCHRKPVWLIDYLGAFCNFHFEDYFTTHTVDPKDIQRLSDDEADFVVRSRIDKRPGRLNPADQTPREVNP